MILCHKIRLDPTKAQEAFFRKACGVRRFTWNWALARVKETLDAKQRFDLNELKKEFNALKRTEFPWIYESPKDANQRVFANLKKAVVQFFKKTARFPGFKAKGRCRDSFYLSNDRVSLEGKQVRVARLGWVRLREELRFNGRILFATVSREADHWFVSFSIELAENPCKRTVNGTVGVDLGVKTAVTLSTGEQFAGPKPLRTHLKKLKRAQRRLSRKKKGSKNRQKQVTKVARIHARVKAIRLDFLHKLTTKLCRENQAVVIEDLCVRGMVKNRRLARAISDIGFYEFRRQLTYKAPMYETELIVADRWFPSSKTCNACGTVKAELTLSDRVFQCDTCGHKEDRDLNAAKNLRDLAVFDRKQGKSTDGLSETNACGENQRCLPRKRKVTGLAEAGTRKSRSLERTT